MYRHVFAIDVFGEGYLAAFGIHGMNFIVLDLVDALPRAARAFDAEV